ncbi:MAG: hypothetical protein COZ88_00705 [Candidatus Nealsonbacteria bacterium CG_4_8_14_3_um_filter_34_13]|nr:MAG: hypothetical protein COZ88_00705 [Candidatus Nealsonbacteria bacterium CG_4_8_14_3_um_filter_34_13]
MVKKVFDIISPEHLLKEDKETEQKSLVFSKRYKEVKKEKTQYAWLSKKRRVIFLISLLILVGIYFFVEGKTTVEITPRQEAITLQTQVVVKSKTSQINFENKIIPGIFFQEVKEFEEKFVSSGEIEKKEKAKGTLRVYNNYSPPSPLTLVKGTHFLSSIQGKSFHSLEVINLPSAKTQEGKLIPGFSDIEIEADEAGENYNIPPATFSIPKLVGTPYYYTTWAESFKPTEGGMKAKVKVVSKQDIEKAKEEFIKNSLRDSEESLKKSIPEGFIFLEDNFLQEVGEINCGAKAEEEKSDFKLFSKINSKVLVFSEGDLKTYSSKIILNSIPPEKKIVPESLTVNFEQKEVNSKEGEVKLDLSISVKIYFPQEEEILKENLKGQELNYALSMLKNLPEIERVNIRISPFWKKKISNNKGDIEIKTQF